MNTPKFDPEKIPHTLNNIFKEFISEVKKNNAESDFTPKADFFETHEAYLIEISLPGIKKEQTTITLKAGKLLIKGERKLNRGEQVRVNKIETEYGGFFREFDINKNVDDNNIEANFKDGLLHIQLHKTTTDHTQKEVNIS